MNSTSTRRYPTGRWQLLVLMVLSSVSSDPVHNCSDDSVACSYYGDCCTGDTHVTRDRRIKCLTDTITVRNHMTIYAVAKCATGYRKNSQFRKACEDYGRSDGIQYIHPVTGGDKLVYRNIYCARCNYQKYIYVPPSTVKCKLSHHPNKAALMSNISLLTNYIEDGNCTITLEQLENNSFLHPCFPNLIYACPNPEEPHKCNNAPASYLTCASSRHVVRNIDCARCHNIDCDTWLRPHFSTVNVSRGRGRFEEFTILFRFTLKNYHIDEDSDDLIDENKNKIILSTITHTASITSVISLAFLLIIYTFVTSFRTFSNALVGSFCATLLFAYMSFLVNGHLEKGTPLCLAASVMLNFFYDSVIAWSAVIAIDMCYIFLAGSRSFNRIPSLKYYTKLALFGWVVPIVVVVFELLIDTYAQNTCFEILAPQYGTEICWLNNNTAVLVWIYVPACAILLTNTVVVILLVFRIRRGKAKLYGSTHYPGHSCIVTVVKLTLVFGLYWLPSMLSVFISNFVFSVIAAFLTGSQGVVLMVVFLTLGRGQRQLSRAISNINLLRRKSPELQRESLPALYSGTGPVPYRRQRSAPFITFATRQ